MDSKERIMAALNHEKTDIVPFSLGFGINEPVRKAMVGQIGLGSAEEVRDYVNSKSDLCWVSPLYIGPDMRNMVLPNGHKVDKWGVERSSFCYGEGTYEEIMHYPLADVENVQQLSEYLFPSADWYDYSELPNIIKRAQLSGRKAIVLGNANLFESAWYMRGLENMMVDLLAQPQLADALLEHVTAFYYAFMERCLDAAKGEIDLIFTADDIGQQRGLLISLKLWERFIKPRHRIINDLVHSFGVKVIYHTDGAVMEALPGLIDMGIDVLEALQFDAAGMDPVIMKSMYGDRLCFHGGVSVQSTLPFGTPEQVRKEVHERIEVLGAKGGYILAPSHAVQAGTPVENVLAFFHAAGRPL